MKFTAFLMALLLVFSLAACTPEDNNGTNDNNNNANLDGDSSDANGSNNGENGANNNTPNTPGNGTNGSANGNTNGDNNMNQNKPDGTPDFGEDYKGDRRFYYAGRLYEITDETVDPDEVGAELFSITDIVEDDPTAEGEGLGLDMDSNIYKFKEENEYDELIVKIGERYYKATVREDDLIPDMADEKDSTDDGAGANEGNKNGGATGGSSGGTN